jgi:hypothetical protein
MAVTANHLETDINTGNLDSYDTGSISPAANELVLIAVSSFVSSGTPNSPTITGCGLTWVLVRTATFVNTHFSSQTQTYCAWSINEFAGVDTGGADGADAVVQADDNQADGVTDLTVTLAAFGDSGNATYGMFLINNDLDIVPDGSFVELGEIQEGTENRTLQTQWYNAADTTVKASWSSSQNSGAIGIEIKASGDITRLLSETISLSDQNVRDFWGDRLL